MTPSEKERPHPPEGREMALRDATVGLGFGVGRRKPSRSRSWGLSVARAANGGRPSRRPACGATAGARMDRLMSGRPGEAHAARVDARTDPCSCRGAHLAWTYPRPDPRDPSIWLVIASAFRTARRALLLWRRRSGRPARRRNERFATRALASTGRARRSPSRERSGGTPRHARIATIPLS